LKLRKLKTTPELLDIVPDKRKRNKIPSERELELILAPKVRPSKETNRVSLPQHELPGSENNISISLLSCPNRGGKGGQQINHRT